MARFLLSTLLLPILAGVAHPASGLEPADRRYGARTEETPDFQRHVLPLLGRLGCNGRACHGSFQGQGGFRLSLFGYDFQADHDALLSGETPRVDRKDPEGSLILLKPTGTVKHEGGKLLTREGWEYRLLRRWIEAGAVGLPEGRAEFDRLEIEPGEIVFGREGQTVQLRVIAHWGDGGSEDVTPLCRFRSNDESIAAVDAAGVVRAAGKGDTHVVAFYDNGVAPVPVLLPVSDLAGARYPEVPTPTKIDELVVNKLRKLGIVPSGLCSDDEFLRRVSLDMTGTLPGPQEVKAFLADRSPDKRARKVDELLERPAYAAWWATRLCDLTANSDRTGPLGGEQGLGREKARHWYAWVHRRVKENRPYDEIVEGIMLAVGSAAGQTYDEYCTEMSAYFRKEKPADFSARETMPYFWTRRTVGKPEDKALSFAHAFLGVSLQCAQCHKHPYDQWTKQDFDQLAIFFNGIRYGGGDRKRMAELKKGTGLEGLDEDSGNYKRRYVQLLAEGRLMPFKDLSVPRPSKQPARKPRPGAKLGRVITPRLLGGEEVVLASYNDPREPLMSWMRQEDNPYFARAFVNRVWASYFSVGLIEPTDDLNLANPPSNRALLDWLAREFIRSGYDMKWLHRTIATSRTYQLSWRPNETNRLDERGYSHAVVRRLPAEAAYDALVLATASDEARAALDADPVATRAIGEASSFSGSRDPGRYAVTLFGKPGREISCDCERSGEPTLLQTVYLRNDQEVHRLIDRKDGWLKQATLAGEADAGTLVREAYLRTLSRLPSEREEKIARGYLEEAASTAAGLRDLLWVLLNTREFIVNR